MDREESLWHEAAVRLVEEKGKSNALLEAARLRDMNSLGTYSYMWANQVVKEIQKIDA